MEPEVEEEPRLVLKERPPRPRLFNPEAVLGPLVSQLQHPLSPVNNSGASGPAAEAQDNDVDMPPAAELEMSEPHSAAEDQPATQPAAPSAPSGAAPERRKYPPHLQKLSRDPAPRDSESGNISPSETQSPISNVLNSKNMKIKHSIGHPAPSSKASTSTSAPRTVPAQ